MQKRKINRVGIILGVLVLSAVSTLASSFNDVAESHWAYKSVLEMQKRGVMLSSSSGDFYPNNIMNYFEIADVLAKATGYVDVNVNTTIDQVFKQQILTNYENQKTILASYETKFTTWDKRYNQQIAYLLGRGYISLQDLNKFVTKGSDQKEVKGTVLKQEMAVFAVRILGKEETAKAAYKVTDFSDDNLILAANKPHVAYLKAIGLLNPDAKGAFNGNAKVSRSLCAKMVSDALLYKEKGTTTPTPTPITTPVTTTPIGNSITVKKIIPKGDTEHWIILEKDQKTTYYAIKNTTKVTDSTGKEVVIANIPLETKVVIVSAILNNTEYITSMQIQAALGEQIAPVNTTITGKVERIGTNGDVTIVLADGTSKTYFMDLNAVVMRSGLVITRNDLSVDETISATIAGDSIIKIVAGITSAGSDTSIVSDGEVTAKINKAEGYVLVLKQAGKTSELIINKNVMIKRNAKSAYFEEIRIGDKIKVIRQQGSIIEIAATGERINIVGEVKGIYIAAVPYVTVKTASGTESFMITEFSEIYDNNQRQNALIRDLRIGQNVEVLIDSKEIVSLVIQKNTTSIKYIGVIQTVGNKNEYIDVLVDYDPVTESSRVIKRIKTPVELLVELDGKKEHRSIFDAGMHVVITYKYIEDVMPERLLIIE